MVNKQVAADHTDISFIPNVLTRIPPSVTLPLFYFSFILLFYSLFSLSWIAKLTHSKTYTANMENQKSNYSSFSIHVHNPISETLGDSCALDFRIKVSPPARSNINTEENTRTLTSVNEIKEQL